MFRLARVLRWKERLEREALTKRAVVEAALRELGQAATRLRTQRQELPDRTDADLATLVTWTNYADALRRREERVRHRMDELRPQVEEAVRVHLAARREVKGLQKLEEREGRRQRKRVERHQQEALDDAASRRFLPGGGTEFPPPTGDDEPWPDRESADAARDGETGPKREMEA